MGMRYQYCFRFEMQNAKGSWCTYSRRYKTAAAAQRAGEKEMARQLAEGWPQLAVRVVTAPAEV